MPLNAIRVFLGLAPKELPKIVHVKLAFAGVAQAFDLMDKGEMLDFTTCQSVYIDNKANGGIFTLIPGGTSMPVYCPSFSVGMFPIACLSKLDFVAALAGAEGTVDLWLLNVPQPYFVYPVA